MNLEKELRKEIQKKRKKGQALLGRPASLSARSAARPNSPSPLPRADAPASLHSAPATWRPYAGVVDAAAQPTGLTRSGRHPAPPDAPFCPLPAPSPSPLTSAAAAATTAAPLLAELRRSPPATLVSHSPRQDHRRARLRRGKPLRTLYQGESHPFLPRPRRSSPDLVGALRRVETLPFLPRFACS